MTRDDFLAQRRAETGVVPCEGHDFFLRPLAAGERREIFDWQEIHGETAVYQILYVRSVCDASGARILQDDDAAQVAGFPLADVEDVVDQIHRLNRMGKHAGKKASSTTTRNSSSPSA